MNPHENIRNEAVRAVLKKDNVIVSTPQFRTSVEAAALVLEQLMPQHAWRVQYIVLKPFPKPSPPEPDIKESNWTPEQKRFLGIE